MINGIDGTGGPAPAQHVVGAPEGACAAQVQHHVHLTR